MDYFMGMVMPCAFNFAPKGFALTNGQLLPVNQNQALYSLLGTQFGGNGIQNFALPNLQGRTIVGYGNAGSAMPMGTTGGEELHTLIASEMPYHNHGMLSASAGSSTSDPTGNSPGATASDAIYGPAGALTTLGGAPMGLSGGSQPHNNMQPFSVINFTIALTGIYPSRN